MTKTEILHSQLAYAAGQVRVTDVKHLASYNWVEAPTPTIVVPGHPPVWSNVRVIKKLKQDVGLVYINQNAARHPDSPLEPLLRALYIEDPTFDATGIHIVSDRNNIRKLLSFIDPTTVKSGLHEFTIKAQVIGNAVWLSRLESREQQTILPHEFRGFGHEFEKAYTTNQIDGSTGHHRIISYSFGRLQIVIRHETDGCIKERDRVGTELQPDDILKSFSNLSLDTSRTDAELIRFESSKLSAQKQGQKVPLSSTLEIKTRVASKAISMHEVMPQLWISQTPKLVRAYHRTGSFLPSTVEDVTQEVQQWETQNQPSLRRLEALLQKIVDEVKGYGHADITSVPSKNSLYIEKVEPFELLPSDLSAMWQKPASVHEEQQEDEKEERASKAKSA